VDASGSEWSAVAASCEKSLKIIVTALSELSISV